MSINVKTMLVEWDDIFAVLRRAAPKLGQYGDDKGGDARKMLAMVRDDALIERIAKELWDAQINRNVAIREPMQKIEKARKDYEAAVRNIVDSIG